MKNKGAKVTDTEARTIKFIVFIFIIIFSFNSCVKRESDILENKNNIEQYNDISIGDLKSNLSGTFENTNRFTLVNPGTIADLYLYTINNNQYLISFDENNKVNYIIINSDTYSIPEKLKNGTSVKSCLKKQGVLMVEQGVCFFVIMKSGWFGYIDEINSDIENIPDANIKFFYKKNERDNYFFIGFEEYKEKRKHFIGVPESEPKERKIHFMPAPKDWRRGND
jgi:hypothetical protein